MVRLYEGALVTLVLNLEPETWNIF